LREVEKSSNERTGKNLGGGKQPRARVFGQQQTGGCAVTTRGEERNRQPLRKQKQPREREPKKDRATPVNLARKFRRKVVGQERWT